MQRLSSSLRRRSAEETLKIIVNDIAPRLGITRVTDTTWLDRIGIPVFASIRPDALKGSLCVNAGKGLRSAEAKIGAYMEAIEFSLAQYNTAQLNLLKTTPRQLIESHEGRIAFNQFCMLYGFSADVDSLIMAIEAEDVLRKQKVLAPAELVFIPYPENPGQQLFGEAPVAWLQAMTWWKPRYTLFANSWSAMFKPLITCMTGPASSIWTATAPKSTP